MGECLFVKDDQTDLNGESHRRILHLEMNGKDPQALYCSDPAINNFAPI